MKKLKVTARWAYLTLILLFAPCISTDTKSHTPIHGPVVNDLTKNEQITWKDLNELLGHVAMTNVVEGISPVIILREINGFRFTHATGALIHSTGMILTCHHAFWKIHGINSGSWKFYYKALQPEDSPMLPICGIEVVEPGLDVIKCLPGKPTPIALTEHAEAEMTFLRFDCEVEPRFARSTVTGERAQILGLLKTTVGNSYSVLDYNILPGQSGTLFAEENRLCHMVSMQLRLTENIHGVIRPPSGRDVVTLCVTISIK